MGLTRDNRSASSGGQRWEPGNVFFATTQALCSAIAAKNTHERDHVERVEMLCRLIAEHMGLDKDTVDGICVAAVLHDVGKLGVPDHILLKPGPLDPEEFIKTSNHAALGGQIVEQVRYPWPIVDMVRHHHEKYDGSGYPDKLAGEAIPLGARIIAVAEVYESLISDRCYRPGWPRKQALEHIKGLSGTHFDPKVVDALIQVEPQMACANKSDTDVFAGQGSERHTAADLIAQSSRELVALFEIGETISSTLQLEEVLDLLTHKTLRMTRATASAVFLVDRSKPDVFLARSSAGRYKEILAGARVQRGVGTSGAVVANAQPYLGKYDPADLHFDSPGNAPRFKSCLVVPIVSFGRVVGSINLYGCCANTFTHDDLRTMTAVAHQAALAVHNARAFEAVRDSASKDPLTGLHNNRYLRVYLDQEVSRASRLGELLSVMQVDLDNFKAVNDNLGHQEGDVVLKDAAGILRRQLRSYDLAARAGGDEFVVVLPGASAESAGHAALRIRAAFDRYIKARPELKALDFGVSIGSATFPVEGNSAESLLAAADKRMYADKRERKTKPLAA